MEVKKANKRVIQRQNQQMNQGALLPRSPYGPDLSVNNDINVTHQSLSFTNCQSSLHTSAVLVS